jgi:hypothetical protein
MQNLEGSLFLVRLVTALPPRIGFLEVVILGIGAALPVIFALTMTAALPIGNSAKTPYVRHFQFSERVRRYRQVLEASNHSALTIKPKSTVSFSVFWRIYSSSAC